LSVSEKTAQLVNEKEAQLVMWQGSLAGHEKVAQLVSEKTAQLVYAKAISKQVRSELC
jgi:hypothetical protein